MNMAVSNNSQAQATTATGMLHLQASSRLKSYVSTSAPKLNAGPKLTADVML